MLMTRLRANLVLPLAIMFLLTLVGCGQERNTVSAELESQVETLELRSPNCASPDACASVTIRRLVFSDRPALNDAIYAQLLEQLQGNGESDSAPLNSLEKVAQKFLEDADAVTVASAASWQLNGDAKLLAHHGNLLTVAINSYLYTGGAHGMPVSHWLNWDLSRESAVALGDVIVAGQEQAFWTLAEEAHQQWLDAQQVDGDFRHNWPFTHSEDFRLTEAGLVLRYGVYTLGPYSMGEVELTLPRDKLAGVIREPYLSATGSSGDGN
ncbi:DUF3298 and DUF4163 domain-containing protein [Microbulbifer sp. CAU 1566]|uniref:DUF3298 and DUF4163 domain-containing protein n=1 Tax=Microbulbifer sp. CAU 1566 TaxID=2933269 RepID=UPI002004BB7D|nr:DUF3298 and DUF4163 domain-containing protein [Microbulbifer sp. CAU 1566]MCK7599005.1 DUF3298 and DUF4163 domain-containing protein [Microbulbifer sp. CAU 1566]